MVARFVGNGRAQGMKSLAKVFEAIYSWQRASYLQNATVPSLPVRGRLRPSLSLFCSGQPNTAQVVGGQGENST